MSSSEEDSYSMIFASLKHPIRRKILRILSSEPQTFSDLQKQFNIESSHLTYHIDGLGNLLYKTEDGKYALSSLGEAAVSMMKNVEEPSPILHLPFTRRSTGIDKRIAGRAVAIALGIICIVLAATLVGAFAYYMPIVNSKNSTISSLNSQIENLQNQTENLQNELNSLLNWSSSAGDMVMSNPSEWENRTVVVEGVLGIAMKLPSESLPYGMILSSGNHTIGLTWNGSWNEIEKNANAQSVIRVYGVIRKGYDVDTLVVNATAVSVVYYIEAEAFGSP